MAKFCENCGGILEGPVKFCEYCGKPVPAAEPPVKPEPAPEPKPEAQEPKADAPATAAKAAAAVGAGVGAAAEDFKQEMKNFKTEDFAKEFKKPASKEEFMDQLKEEFLSFEGRLNRKAYIISNLKLFAFNVLIGIISGFLGDTIGGVLLLLAFAISLAGGISLCLRRLHDLDKGGIWLLLCIVPLVNLAFALYLLCAKGTYGENQYGPDPLQY